MKISKILLIVAVLALLVSNALMIYQDNQNKTKIDKLQTNLTSLQKQVKGVNNNVNNTDSDVQNICSALEDC